MTPPQGRIALVTGAGRGIGRAVAERLSEQGFRVAITSRSKDELAEVAASCAGPTLGLPADITVGAAVEQLFA
ncbi:MAG: 3-hydroxybutyrate dehydrogenase, partial [Pseudonocardiales bacterium]|nr:3-hydroxybutyrate dehydrogenase [Pseudonocardiales bacterium]